MLVGQEVAFVVLTVRASVTRWLILTSESVGDDLLYGLVFWTSCQYRYCLDVMFQTCYNCRPLKPIVN